MLLPGQEMEREERRFKRKTIKSDETMQYTTEIDMFFNRVLCTAYSQLDTCFRPTPNGYGDECVCAKRKEMQSTQNGNFSLVEYMREIIKGALVHVDHRHSGAFVYVSFASVCRLHTWEYRMRSYPLTHNASVNNLIHQGSHRRCGCLGDWVSAR